MSVKTTRAGALKPCICSHCSAEFLTRKLQPFCSANCKHEAGYKSKAAQLTLSQPILEGASNNESTIEHPSSR